MINGYTQSQLVIEDKKADSCAVKGLSSPVQVYQFVDGKVVIDTTNYSVGMYYIQFFKNDEVIKQDQINIMQNLKYASANYDPRSNAQKILDAINAVLEGRATAEAYHVRVGQKQIIYMSFSELMNFKNFYEKLVKKEMGKAVQIRHQKLYYRSV